MPRPLIGLTTYGENITFRDHPQYVAALPMTYIHAVHAAGGRAVLITEDDPGTDVLDALDGIVFTGGADVAPDLYGEVAHPETGTRPARDALELPLMRAAIEADLPMLAICRGMQMMAVAYGGSLYQHLPDVLGHDAHAPAAVQYGAHDVRFVPGTAVHAVLGDACAVNSRHHQGVADPGSLTVAGRVPGEFADGAELIEAVEDPSRRFALGVQWHPEATDDNRLFAALVQAATRSHLSLT